MIDPTSFHGTSGGVHIATYIWNTEITSKSEELKKQLYNDGKLFVTPKWEIQLMPKNIGFNGLNIQTNTNSRNNIKTCYLVDEFGE